MVLLSKKQKSRHKILYKNFISLKKNVQNRRKLNLLNFKKHKWKNFIFYLKKQQIRSKKNFNIYDINRYFLSKFSNLFDRKFKYIQQTKKKFKIFYNGLLKKHLKKNIKITLKQKKILLQKYENWSSFFFKLFEKRLDIVLYRSHFSLNIRLAKQLIFHNHVKVNNYIVNNNSYILKFGDLIEINSAVHKIVKLSLKNLHFWPIPPKYLNINYKTLQILFDNTKLIEFFIHFPFWVDFYTILRYCK